VPYCCRQHQATELLVSRKSHSVVAAALETRQRELGHHLSLADQLLAPVQRLLKYPLLLGEQLKDFSPKGIAAGYSQEGSRGLERAAADLRDVAATINSARQRHQLDSVLYVASLWLSLARRFVADYTLFYSSSSSPPSPLAPTQKQPLPCLSAVKSLARLLIQYFASVSGGKIASQTVSLTVCWLLVVSCFSSPCSYGSLEYQRKPPLKDRLCGLLGVPFDRFGQLRHHATDCAVLPEKQGSLRSL